MAASAWRHAKADTEAYRHFVAAIDEWDACAALQLEEPSEERLLDQMTDDSAPRWTRSSPTSLPSSAGRPPMPLSRPTLEAHRWGVRAPGPPHVSTPVEF